MDTTPDPIPLVSTGTPVNASGARLIRSRHVSGRPVVVQVWGAYTEGDNWSSEQSIVVGDKNQLQSLITELVLLQTRWAKE